MVKKILKKSLFSLFAICAFSISAQKTTFSTGLEGWDVSYGNNGTVAHAPTEGTALDGALKLVRTTNNANFGIKPAPGVNATDKKIIKIKYKNLTKATSLRISGKNDDATAIKTDTGGSIDVNISPSLDEYVITYVDMAAYALWKGDLTDFNITVRKNSPDDAGTAFYLDEIEFLETAPETTFSEFIQNPSFDGPSGISHLTGNKPFATRAITSAEMHDGDQSLKSVFSTDADEPYSAFSNYEKTYESKFPVDSDIQVKMWVKTNRTSSFSISARVKLTDGGVDTATKPFATVVTTNTVGAWEELTFNIKNAEEFDGITLWFILNYTDGETTNFVSGDVVYIDQMMASITAATAGVNDNVLENTATYPNPVRDILNIKSPKGSKISLFNILGAKVKSATNTSDKLEISVKDLPKGVYMLKINSENKTKTSKVIIK